MMTDDTTIAWERGGAAKLVEIEDDRVMVLSSTPSAPGSRPAGKLADGNLVRMKVHNCRKTDEGTFELRGRLLDATRVLREELAKRVNDVSAGAIDAT